MADQTNLTAKQAAFCREYLTDLNATAAAVRAGYSEKTARQAGSQNLSKPAIQAEVARLTGDRNRRVELTADDVLQELRRIAFADVGELFDGGKLRPLAEIPEGARRAISSLETTETKSGIVTKIRLSDKIRALELAGKHLRLFTPRIEVSGPDGQPLQTEARPDSRAVGDYAQELLGGWRDFRDADGEAAEVDAETHELIARVVAHVATGDAAVGDARELGQRLAASALIARKLRPPASWRGAESAG